MENVFPAGRRKILQRGLAGRSGGRKKGFPILLGGDFLEELFVLADGDFVPIEVKSRNAIGGISQNHPTGRNENFFMAQCSREIPKKGLVNYPCPQREKSYCPEGAQSDGPSAKNAGPEYLFRRFNFLIPNMNILYLG